MKKLLLAAMAVTNAAFCSIEIENKHFGLVKMKGHPTITIGETTVDNVLMRSGTLLVTAGKVACGVPRALSQGEFKIAGIYAVLAPTLVAGAASELVTGSFRDIAYHCVDNRTDERTIMAESTIMNALDLW